MAEIISVENLLKKHLSIPNYQRPYKWKIKNIDTLLCDITDAIEDYERYHHNFQYRIGTIIIHDKSSKVQDIVDGQQRVISLTLIRKCLDPKFTSSILQVPFYNKESQQNIHNNYNYIQEWFSLKDPKVKQDFLNAFENILEVVLISVSKVSEAFQLFDSQNSRGKPLDPHNLLKAYHLREMQSDTYEMQRAVTKWEAKDSGEIRELFSIFLYPIWNWSRNQKAGIFSTKEIDIYKGVSEHSDYTYAKRVNKAMPYFQLTEPFVAGGDFFEMVDHYMQMLKNIKQEIANNPMFKNIFEIVRCTTNPNDDDDTKEFIKTKNGSVGFRHAKNLFYCAVLSYYDRFHNFEPQAMKKICLWAFMLRLDMEALGFDSVNKYALGEHGNTKYTNYIPLFSRICYARRHAEISALQIRFTEHYKEKWEPLHKLLNRL